MDVSTLYPLALRWFHFVAGITWIGILYFFNLVNVPAMKMFDGPTKQKITTVLLVRALWWFRWGATATVLAGLGLMSNMANAAGGWGNFYNTESGRTIMLGGFLGLVMWVNVWFVIWPNQKKVISATENTMKNGAPAPAEQPQWARTAFLASRTNFVLSLPMLVGMASSSHLADFRTAFGLMLVAVVLGLIWVWYLGQPKPAPAAQPAPPSANPPAMK